MLKASRPAPDALAAEVERLVAAVAPLCRRPAANVHVLYLPDGASGAVPGIVMAHGFSAVKEQHLDTFAEVFAGAGFGVLVFDNRNFGASDGEPRQEIDPVQQVRDYRHAITFIGTL